MNYNTRLSRLEDGLRAEAASVRKAAAHAASRHALMSADRERILALTEELKTQQRQAKTKSQNILQKKRTLSGHFSYEKTGKKLPGH